MNYQVQWQYQIRVQSASGGDQLVSSSSTDSIQLSQPVNDRRRE